MKPFVSVWTLLMVFLTVDVNFKKGVSMNLVDDLQTNAPLSTQSSLAVRDEAKMKDSQSGAAPGSHDNGNPKVESDQQGDGTPGEAEVEDKESGRGDGKLEHDTDGDSGVGGGEARKGDDDDYVDEGMGTKQGKEKKSRQSGSKKRKKTANVGNVEENGASIIAHLPLFALLTDHFCCLQRIRPRSWRRR